VTRGAPDAGGPTLSSAAVGGDGALRLSARSGDRMRASAAAIALAWLVACGADQPPDVVIVTWDRCGRMRWGYATAAFVSAAVLARSFGRELVFDYRFGLVTGRG